MNFCMEDCSIELVVFWLDAEHFRHFDGNDDDIKLFAHHIGKLFYFSLSWEVHFRQVKLRDGLKQNNNKKPLSVQ